MKDRKIYDFEFLGGSTQQAGKSLTCREARKLLVGYYPDIFPQGHKIPDEEEGISTVVVDIPLDTGDGVDSSGTARMVCAYFRKRTGRAFWNVLCFAYSTREWDLASRQACLQLSADQWYDIATALQETDTCITLPEPDKTAEPVTWDGNGIYARNFPLRNGKSLHKPEGTTGNWREIMELEAPTPAATQPKHKQAPASQQKPSGRLTKRHKPRMKPLAWLALGVVLGVAVCKLMPNGSPETDIQKREETITKQAKTIRNQEDKIRDLNATIEQQAKTIRKLEDKIQDLNATIEQQAKTIQKRMNEARGMKAAGEHPDGPSQEPETGEAPVRIQHPQGREDHA